MEGLLYLPSPMTPSEKPSSHDPLADLDDDLGDDWESAFQAEDFMFSPENEPSDFFLFDENAPAEGEDIADLLAGQDEKAKDKSDKTAGASATPVDGEPSAVLEFPGRLQILAASLLQLFQACPLYQRLLIGTLPAALILIIVSTLFFQASNEELASLDEEFIASDSPVLATVSQEQGALSPAPAPPPPVSTVAAKPQAEPVIDSETVQHKWQLPPFIIVAGEKNKAELIVNIDLTLIAKLEKGQSLPEDKQIFVKDIIYQFYSNRPAYELKRFALARGEMISQLNVWLNKEWQNNPIDTITFSRYQVIQTTPSLAPKVTFM